MTAYNAKEDKAWSCEKKMEECDGLRTLECLRGRLLAERQASRTSKENAEFLEIKLVELENKLKEETKMRKKAEKRLKILMKKLESLNISSNYEASEQSSSSSVSTSGSKDSDEHNANSQAIHSADSKDNILDTVTQNSVSDESNHNYSTPIPNEESSSNEDVSDCWSDKAENVGAEGRSELKMVNKSEGDDGLRYPRESSMGSRRQMIRV